MIPSMPIITRFAPSPTGPLHLGNVRTALFNWLLARGASGRFLLRIEDSDQERSSEEQVCALLEDLAWLGLDWDAGPGTESAEAPFQQSKRGPIYEPYYTRLQEADRAYPCYCREEELEVTRQAQRARGQPPRYPGHCRNLDPVDRRRLEAEGRAPCLRFRVEDAEIAFHDLVRGPQRFRGEAIGDFIIRRRNGAPAFFFSNAVDDALMGVNRVLRGEDHLANTPRQLLILKALDLPTPEYGHMALLVGSDGAPLSKRNGSQSVAELRRSGYLPEAVINYLGRLGHHLEEEKPFPLDRLAKRFAVNRLSRSPARFDPTQLRHWQRALVQELAVDRLWQWLAPFLKTEIPSSVRDDWLQAIRPNIEYPSDAELWAQICFGAIAPDAEAQAVLTETDPALWPAAEAALSEHGLDYEAVSEALKTATGLKGKALFKPLRAALTGRTSGPELKALLPLIGTEKALARVRSIKGR